jgi:DNA-binding CsgD family transcriptional regulator
MERLLEREAALAELGRLLRAPAGAGRVMLLRGEAGVGKTAVVRRFITRVNSATVLVGWCDPLAAPRPLGPLIDALAGLSPAAAGGLISAIESGDTGALYRRLLMVLRSGQRWVWVIEDAHWADGATLDLVRFLTRRIESLPVLLVVTYREDEVDRQHPLSVALGDLAGCAGISRVRLEPLSRAAVAVLAAGSGVNAGQLHEVTGGNPFYLTEVLAAGAEALRRRALPHSVTEAVWGRLARLSSDARAVADAAATCGPRVAVNLLDRVCPDGDAALAECVSAGVLLVDEQGVRFRHELARRATLEQIPETQRRMLHKRALTALAEPPINPNALAALAFHADQAGDTDAVIRHGVAAAERSIALGANREAAQLYALVLGSARAVPPDQKVHWVEQHALASYLCGLAEEAVSSWREAIQLRQSLGDPLGQSENLRWLSHELWGMGRVREAFDAARDALALVDGAGPCPQLGWALANLAELGGWGFDPAAADYAARAITIGTRLGDDALVIRGRAAAAMRQVLTADTGWEQLETAWRDGMGATTRGEHAGLVATVICWLAAVHHDGARADRYLADSLAYCRERQVFTFEALVTGVDALLRMQRGDWDHARTVAEDLLTRPGLAAVNRTLPQLVCGLVSARRGQQPAAPPFGDDLGGVEPDQLRLFSVWAARAEAAWLAGDDDACRSEARAGLAVTPAHADPWLIGALQRWLHLTGDDPSPGSDDPRTPFELEIRGDWQAAAAEWLRRRCPYDAAIARLGGDVAAVESALATFRNLGARAAARRAQQRLSALRGSARRGRRAETHANPHALTRREHEVLQLLAGGQSDAQIAAALHISTRTVSCHVSKILLKLGAANRTQAAGQFRLGS